MLIPKQDYPAARARAGGFAKAGRDADAARLRRDLAVSVLADRLALVLAMTPAPTDDQRQQLRALLDGVELHRPEVAAR